MNLRHLCIAFIFYQVPSISVVLYHTECEKNNIKQYIHFYITCYIYNHDNVKLETCHVLAVDDLLINTGMRTITLGCVNVDYLPNIMWHYVGVPPSRRSLCLFWRETRQRVWTRDLDMTGSRKRTWVKSWTKELRSQLVTGDGEWQMKSTPNSRETSRRR